MKRKYIYEKKKTTRTQHNKTQRAELNSILHFYYYPKQVYPHTCPTEGMDGMMIFLDVQILYIMVVVVVGIYFRLAG